MGRDPVTGQLRQVSRSTRKGIADARKLRAKLVTEVTQGKHGGTSGTLGSLLGAWLAHCESEGRSPTTLAEYHRKVDTAIIPALGSIRLDRLTAHDLDRFYGTMTVAGLAPRSVQHHHRIISAALATGERWGWVERNVAKLARPPAVHPKALTVPPPKRVRALIEKAASSKSPELATLITVAALTGLRRGELCGLRWSDIDWPGRALTVHRSIWQTADGWGVKVPKTHQVRRLLLGEHAVAVLGGRWGRVTSAAGLAEVPLSDDAYVFSPELTGEAAMLPDTVTAAFGRLCRGMATSTGEPWPYRFHDLRHYTATELFRAGHNPRTVADRLGHADAALTLRVYTHDTEDQARAAADAIEAGIALAPNGPVDV